MVMYFTLSAYTLTSCIAISWLITTIQCDYPRIEFSGYEWMVKIGYRKPGPNHFVDIPFVYDGKLFLLASQSANGSWITSEVYTTKSFGYGTYVFNVSSDLSNLDPNVVLGLFTWDSAPDYANREIDIEVAKWGNSKLSTNVQYTVQPNRRKGNVKRFYRAKGNAPSTEMFTWKPNSIHFSTIHEGKLVHNWTFKGSDVARKGNEKVHINLWLWRGKGPSNRKPVIIVIDSFQFIPL